MMNKLGIYIHIPFCIKKCDYCDFLSAPTDAYTRQFYIRMLKKEIELSKNKMAGYVVDTVFIGGGTPSIIEGKDIADILGTLKCNCKISDDVEITIECNPGTVTAEKLQYYKNSGINRLSIGLQSANDNELKSIGRIHNYEQFLQSYHLARETGFNNINIDIMSALPGQSEISYKETLEKVISLNPEHISAYSLIVEKGTRLHRRVEGAKAKGVNILPDEDVERKMYYMTKTVLQKGGYCQYEISNYSKRGFECRHNVGYWKRKDYLGFGIGAASLYKEERYNNISDLEKYISKVYSRNTDESIISANKILNEIEENQQKLTVQEQMEEFMFLGLRMIEGVSTEDFERKFSVGYDDVYGEITAKLVEQRLLIRDNNMIKLTQRGIDVSNHVMAEFLF